MVCKPFAYKVKFCSKRCHRDFENDKNRKLVENTKVEKSCSFCKKIFMGGEIDHCCSTACYRKNQNAKD